MYQLTPDFIKILVELSIIKKLLRITHMGVFLGTTPWAVEIEENGAYCIVFKVKVYH